MPNLCRVFHMSARAQAFVIVAHLDDAHRVGSAIGQALEVKAACGLNMGQLLSIPFIVMGIWLIARAYRRPRVKLEFPNKFPDEKK